MATINKLQKSLVKAFSATCVDVGFYCRFSQNCSIQTAFAERSVTTFSKGKSLCNQTKPVRYILTCQNISFSFQANNKNVVRSETVDVTRNSPDEKAMWKAKEVKHGIEASEIGQSKLTSGMTLDHTTSFPAVHALDKIDWSTELQIIKKLEERSPFLEPTSEELSNIASNFVPTFNFAAYINKSPTLQELVKLGVDLYKWEKKKDIPEYILKLDFDKDMKEHIRFLHDAGVLPDDLGRFLTKNPSIFKETLDDMQVRINYLESKRFSPEMISTIISRNPYWLMFSSECIDQRLGLFQRKFGLSGSEVRKLATKLPRLITCKMKQVQVISFVVKEEMGFSDEEMKELLLKKPKLWMRNQKGLLERFEYVHNVMKISHEQLVRQPEVLNSRVFRIKQRHLFLQSLSRDQYDPKMEGYVSMKALVQGTDVAFCRDVAKTSVEVFNTFLKTL